MCFLKSTNIDGLMKSFSVYWMKILTYFTFLEDRYPFMVVSLFHQEAEASMHAYSGLTDYIAHSPRG